MNLFPWTDVLESADARIAAGWDVYQQWNCSHCGAKQTMEDANKFYTLGICEECKQTTNIKDNGMNFMATMGVPHRGITIVGLDDPALLHNAIAEAVGEPPTAEQNFQGSRKESK